MVVRSRSFRPLSSAGEHLAPAHELFTKDSLITAIRRRSAQFAVSGEIAVCTMKNLRAPRSFTKMGPAQRIRLLGSSSVLPRQADRYIKDATQANLTKQVKDSLPGMASASRFYTDFFDLGKPPPSPVREGAALQWSSVFNNTATFGNYVSLLEKCCFFPPFPHHVEDPLRQACGQGLGKMSRQELPLPGFHSHPPSPANNHP